MITSKYESCICGYSPFLFSTLCLSNWSPFLTAKFKPFFLTSTLVVSIFFCISVNLRTIYMSISCLFPQEEKKKNNTIFSQMVGTWLKPALDYPRSFLTASAPSLLPALPNPLQICQSFLLQSPSVPLPCSETSNTSHCFQGPS